MMSSQNANSGMNAEFDSASKEIRRLILTALQKGGRGHLGPAFSLVEILDVLYGVVLVNDPEKPKDPDRDRFILSKGHGVLALYAVLAKCGYFNESVLHDFCGFNSPIAGHPERDSVPGIEFSTGSLGHGLSVGIGMAMSAKIKNKAWKTFVLVGDGEIAEGSIWEAALHASKHKLGNLTVIIDNNKMQASGLVDSVLPLEPISKKWEAFGFDVQQVDGHDRGELARVLGKETDVIGNPRLIIAHTVKGKGIEKTENAMDWHHKAKISSDEINELINLLEKK
jgi:transketolase